MPLIKILDHPNGGFYSAIVVKDEIIFESKKLDNKESVVKNARALISSGAIEIGDFTTRKSPVKKAKVEPVKKEHIINPVKPKDKILFEGMSTKQ